MNADVLLKHFDLISEAPNAIRRLRQFILNLAIRGKLVEQHSGDEPAEVLLRKIDSARASRGSGSNQKTGAALPEASKALFEVPPNWLWVPFGRIVFSRDGERRPVSQQEREGRAKVFDYYGASGVIDKIDSYLFDKPLLLIGEDGANLVNRSTPIAFIARGKYWVNNHAHVLDGISEEFLRFLELFINAIDLVPYVTGTAQPKMNQAKMNSIPVALPPESEQIRIISKVDELMALCDRVEEAQLERERQIDRLTALSIRSLNRNVGGDNLHEQAQFFINHLPKLTVRPEHIKQIRQLVLNLAVKGKLVPQDSRDESASALIERIEDRKASLLGESRLRKTKACRLLDKTDLPHDIPDSWAWTMLGDITDIGTGGTPSRSQPSFWDGGTIPWTTSGSTSQDLITGADELITDAAVKAHRLRLYRPGTLLVALYGQGKTRGQVATLGIASTINQACAAVCPLEGFESLHPYLQLFLLKNYDEVRLLSAGGTQPNLNVQKIKELLIPLPPLNEQTRIVGRVDQMLAICNELEEQLFAVRTETATLLEAVLYEAVAGLTARHEMTSGCKPIIFPMSSPLEAH